MQKRKKKKNREKNCLLGEIYSEIVEIEGKPYEHLGFRDYKNEFGKMLEKLVGKKVRVCIEVIDEKEEDND